MRSWLLLPLGLAACRGSSTLATSNTGPALSHADAGPLVDAAPSEERPPQLVMPVRSDVPATADEETPITLAGVYGAPEERARRDDDEAACAEPVTLDRRLKVVDRKGTLARDGRGVGAHPTLGDATRVCLWSWKGYEPGRGTMMPWGSHVVVVGTLSTPIVASNPRALLVFGTEVVSVTSPPIAAPPNAFPDGDSIVYVSTVDESTRTLGVDLAYLYYGDAAAQLAAARKVALPPGRNWYIANDSSQLRTLVLPPPQQGVTAQRLGDRPGDGWRTVPLADLNKPPLAPYIVTLEKGALKSFREVSLR